MANQVSGRASTDRRSADDSAAAHNQLARRAGQTAYVFALQLTRDPEAAKDISQDAVLSFFRHLDRFDSSRALEPWLYQIVRNKVRDTARRDGVRRHESLDRWLEHSLPETADPAEGPAAAAERRDLQARIWRAISGLEPPHREILVLRDFHDLKYREIAAVLAIPQGTVMSRLHAARNCLREILIAAGEGPRGSGGNE